MHDGRRTPATKGCDITLMRVASFRCESGAAESEAFRPSRCESMYWLSRALASETCPPHHIPSVKPFQTRPALVIPDSSAQASSRSARASRSLPAICTVWPLEQNAPTIQKSNSRTFWPSSFFQAHLAASLSVGNRPSGVNLLTTSGNDLLSSASTSWGC